MVAAILTCAAQGSREAARAGSPQDGAAQQL
eukprot:SAG31_NODE_17908_length_654_cov_0.504505_1_plen_30_part_10